MAAEAEPHRRGVARLVLLNLVMVLAVAALAGLGTWQVHRRTWKHDLIARVDARVHAPAVPAPGPATWADITAEADAYRRVTVSGTYRTDRTTLVQALTALGAGSWVLTPLDSTSGFTVLVNRGFVPSDRRASGGWRREDGPVTVTGLLRISEPGGAFLRDNDPAGDRWTSRDVAAIARARGLDAVAPYFIDADAGPRTADGGESLPVGGLTVVAFPDNHLVYAITWYAMALMAAGALVAVDLDAARGRAPSA